MKTKEVTKMKAKKQEEKINATVQESSFDSLRIEYIKKYYWI